MILFPVLCALLIALALVAILRPLRHPDRIAGTSTTTEANAAVYRGELIEMTSDLHLGILTNEQFVLDREELEIRLSVDLASQSSLSGEERPTPGSELLIYGLAVVVPLSAVLLYLALGTPQSLL